MTRPVLTDSISVRYRPDGAFRSPLGQPATTTTSRDELSPSKPKILGTKRSTECCTLTVSSSQLLCSGHSTNWFVAYSTVIGEDNGSGRAIKGLLQVAERILNERQHPAAALKVYRYLMEHCSDSPLREYMTQGVAASERSIAERANPKS